MGFRNGCSQPTAPGLLADGMVWRMTLVKFSPAHAVAAVGIQILVFIDFS